VLHKLKIQSKKSGGMSQVVQCVPRKCMVQSSNPRTAKKKAKNLQKITQHNLIDMRCICICLKYIHMCAYLYLYNSKHAYMCTKTRRISTDSF
jgi:hypothetical protein